MSVLFLADESATLAAGALVARLCGGKGIIFLHGTLGAGKTTFSRGLIQQLGHTGSVKSPTYTLVEPYELGHIRVMHYDLYRLGEPEELDYIGLQDHLDNQTLTLIEWPEKGGRLLPVADLELFLEVVSGARELRWLAHSPLGTTIASGLAAKVSIAST